MEDNEDRKEWTKWQSSMVKYMHKKELHLWQEQIPNWIFSPGLSLHQEIEELTNWLTNLEALKQLQ